MLHPAGLAADPRARCGRWPAAALAAVTVTAALLLAACSSTPQRGDRAPSATQSERLPISQSGNDVAIYALDMIGANYRFGGKNPEAGLDCSGMVSYVYRQAANMALTGSAADIARRGKQIERRMLRPGDLIFFNTSGKSFSHVAIYIGENRFVHAPATNGKVRIDRLDNRYYDQRFEMARSYFE